MDLRALAALAPARPEPERVLAPYRLGDAGLRDAIARLRAAGCIVIVDLPGHEATRDALGCSRELVQRGGEWTTIERGNNQSAGT